MSGGVPAGWVLVPEVATPQMIEAYEDCYGFYPDGPPFEFAWATVLSATPTPPIEGRDADVERVARALAQRFIDRGKARVTGSTYERWEEMPGSYKRDFYDDARAALQALGERG